MAVSLPVEPTIQPTFVCLYVAICCLTLSIIYYHHHYLLLSIVYLTADSVVSFLCASSGWNHFQGYLQVMPAAGRQLFPVGQEVESENKTKITGGRKT